jgi:hypothetical protein
MIDLTPYETLTTAALYPALVHKARELAIAKGQGSLTDVELMERLYREHPEVHEYLRCRTMGIPVPKALTTPAHKADTSQWHAYAPLDFPATQAHLLDAARAEAVQKGRTSLTDPHVMDAYFASHPEAYAVYTHKHRYGTGLPAHLRGQAGDVRKGADELVLFTKVGADPELRDLARVRALERAAFRQAVVALARSVVRKSDALQDCSDGVALDVLFSYREDLYRLWQEKQAA